MSRLARPLPARTRRQVVEQVAPRYREASFAQKILLLESCLLIKVKIFLSQLSPHTLLLILVKQ